MKSLCLLLAAPILLSSGPMPPSNEWQRQAIAHIVRYYHYPPAAQRLGREGTVHLRLRVRHDGSLVWSRLERSSGEVLLDDAALRMVKAASPFPPLDPQVPAETEMLLPITFRIAR